LTLVFSLTLLVSVLLYLPFIKLLRKFKVGQYIREEGPDLHNYKTGTPTMGGLLFLLIPMLMILPFSLNGDYLSEILTVAVFGTIGFLDDILSVLKKHATGLKGYQKLILQLLGAAFLLWMMEATVVKKQFVPLFGAFDFGFWAYPLSLLGIVGASNAVNLTDGVDGLAGWNFVLTAGMMELFAVLRFGLRADLFLLATIASVLGFLWYNSKPAKLFMGDTGSLALGALLAVSAIRQGLLLYLVFAGFVFVLETLSVIIQVASFKLRGKRVFLMSPLHHHFELKGWREETIVFRSLILALLIGTVGMWL